jgi:hypothetical protein
MATHTLILATWEVEIERIMIRGQSRQKCWGNPMGRKKKAGYDGVCLSSKLHGKLTRRISAQAES